MSPAEQEADPSHDPDVDNNNIGSVDIQVGKEICMLLKNTIYEFFIKFKLNVNVFHVWFVRFNKSNNIGTRSKLSVYLCLFW